jgi:hypothetical protein
MKIRIIVLVGILLISLSVFLTTRTTSQNKSKRYIVKLYSGDKVMVTWDARDIGRLEGESLVFFVCKDIIQEK